jgi:hypothetical protein
MASVDLVLQRTVSTAERGQAVRIGLPRDRIATPAFPAFLASHPSLRTNFAESFPIVAPRSYHVQTPPKILKSHGW